VSTDGEREQLIMNDIGNSLDVSWLWFVCPIRMTLCGVFVYVLGG
jgi:hypothetical protein